MARQYKQTVPLYTVLCNSKLKTALCILLVRLTLQYVAFLRMQNFGIFVNKSSDRLMIKHSDQPRHTTSHCTTSYQNLTKISFLLGLDVVEVLAQRQVPDGAVLGQPNQESRQVWVQTWGKSVTYYMTYMSLNETHFYLTKFEKLSK